MTPHDQDTILFYAFRYALGRMTYCVNDIAGLLLKYQHILTDNHKELIIKEIRHAILRGDAGMKMDVQEWEKVLNGFATKQETDLASVENDESSI